MTDPFDLHEIGVEAYTYAYSLVTMEISRRQMTNAAPGQAQGRGPMNGFTHVPAFPTAAFRDVVRPNFDTLYSSAWLDLGDEPLVITVPDTDGRYYLLPMLDMWTDVFASPGWRTSGTQAGAFALVAPGWNGSLPDDVERIDAPTPGVWIVGRTQTNGPADYPAVHEVQAGFTVVPLSRWIVGQGPLPVPADLDVDPTIDMDTAPLDQVNALSARDFFTLAAQLMAVHPPHPNDWTALARFARIGLVAGEPFDWDALPEATQTALETVPGEAVAGLLALIPELASPVNNWLVLANTMGVYGTFYAKRAIIAMIGLGANLPEDAIYPLLEADADGDPIDGSREYVLRFAAEDLPPVSAFWSVTMYDEAGFQVANELDRFAIGDRDPLAYADDGSLTLYIQHTNPGPDREANWLPAPTGALGITMRLYAPKVAALHGAWTPPPLTKA
jgi:hypothetical protein